MPHDRQVSDCINPASDPIRAHETCNESSYFLGRANATLVQMPSNTFPYSVLISARDVYPVVCVDDLPWWMCLRASRCMARSRLEQN